MINLVVSLRTLLAERGSKGEDMEEPHDLPDAPLPESASVVTVRATPSMAASLFGCSEKR